jgi:hypothetical protein
MSRMWLGHAHGSLKSLASFNMSIRGENFLICECQESILFSILLILRSKTFAVGMHALNLQKKQMRAQSILK